MTLRILQRHRPLIVAADYHALRNVTRSNRLTVPRIIMAANKVSENQTARRYVHSTAYDLFILLLTTCSLTLIAVLVILGPDDTELHAVLVRVDFLICVVFLYDFALTLLRTPDKTGYLLKQGGWLDLAGAVPVLPGASWTAVLRCARLNRLARIIRRFRRRQRGELVTEALQAPAGAALLTVVFLALLLITLSSLLILRAEGEAANAEITNGADAFWWAVVTMTTVGYGDYVPVTYVGRFIALLLMVFGIGIFAVLTNFVASSMPIPPDEDDRFTTIAAENARIRAELEDIKALLKAGTPAASAGDKRKEADDVR